MIFSQHPVSRPLLNFLGHFVYNNKFWYHIKAAVAFFEDRQVQLEKAC